MTGSLFSGFLVLYMLPFCELSCWHDIWRESWWGGGEGGGDHHCLLVLIEGDCVWRCHVNVCSESLFRLCQVWVAQTLVARQRGCLALPCGQCNKNREAKALPESMVLPRQ